jgi:hypothetical protein
MSSCILMCCNSKHNEFQVVGTYIMFRGQCPACAGT